MDNQIWLKMHGGTTHFPIALMMASLLFDAGAQCVPENKDKTRRASLHAAGYYTLVLGALGSFGAVFSGLMMTHWQLRGVGNLARHHLYLWPAFALLIGLAVWRVLVGKSASRFAFKCYLGVSFIAAVLCGAAGYWGGELVMNG
jgi:uncharacterized membrane protein